MRCMTVGIVVVALVGRAEAAVICKAKSGAMVIRDSACKKKEAAVTLADFGAVGATGAAGAAGATGATGPSNGYSTGFTSTIAIPESQGVTLLSLAVPDGSYIVSARLQGITVTDPDGAPGNEYRYDCDLSGPGAAIDSPTARVETIAGIESFLTFQGGYTGSGPITLHCSAGNNHPLNAISGSLTAIKVGSLN